MNTRLNFALPAGQTNRFSRAAFSPIRTARANGRSVAQHVQTGAPVFRAPTLTIPPLSPAETDWPAWHRGPLDRLQPVLTRYRD